MSIWNWLFVCIKLILNELSIIEQSTKVLINQCNGYEGRLIRAMEAWMNNYQEPMLLPGEEIVIFSSHFSDFSLFVSLRCSLFVFVGYTFLDQLQIWVVWGATSGVGEGKSLGMLVAIFESVFVKQQCPHYGLWVSLFGLYFCIGSSYLWNNTVSRQSSLLGRTCFKCPQDISTRDWAKNGIINFYRIFFFLTTTIFPHII